MVSFSSAVNVTHRSNNSFSSGVNSTRSPSEKNCDNVIPKPLQIASSVAIEGTVLALWRKIFANVDSERLHISSSVGAVQPRTRKADAVSHVHPFYHRLS